MKQDRHLTLRHWPAWTQWSVAVAVAACTAACTGDDGLTGEDIAAQRPGVALSTRSIRIEAGTDAAAEDGVQAAGSRQVVDSDWMPEGYTLYTSAYYTNVEAPETEGNYFCADPYKQVEGIWCTERSTQFWPLNGQLQFLAIAADPTTTPIADKMVWAARRYTDGVQVQVPVNYGRSEVLYAITEPIDCHADIVPMTFHHAQALLEFDVKLNGGDGLKALAGIVVNDVAKEGTLNVATYPFLDVTWNIDTVAFDTLYVQGSGSKPKLESEDRLVVVLSTSFARTCTVAVVPQEQTSFTINLLKRSDISTPWADAELLPTTYRCTGRKWAAGRKYKYIVNIAAEASK